MSLVEYFGEPYRRDRLRCVRLCLKELDPVADSVVVGTEDSFVRGAVKAVVGYRHVTDVLLARRRTDHGRRPRHAVHVGLLEKESSPRFAATSNS